MSGSFLEYLVFEGCCYSILQSWRASDDLTQSSRLTLMRQAIFPKKLPFSRPPKSGAGSTGDTSLLTDIVRRFDISSDDVCLELVEVGNSSPFKVVDGDRSPTRFAASSKAIETIAYTKGENLSIDELEVASKCCDDFR